jgi:hypothetical protein
MQQQPPPFLSMEYISVSWPAPPSAYTTGTGTVTVTHTTGLLQYVTIPVSSFVIMNTA